VLLWQTKQIGRYPHQYHTSMILITLEDYSLIAVVGIQDDGNNLQQGILAIQLHIYKTFTSGQVCDINLFL